MLDVLIRVWLLQSISKTFNCIFLNSEAYNRVVRFKYLLWTHSFRLLYNNSYFSVKNLNNIESTSTVHLCQLNFLPVWLLLVVVPFLFKYFSLMCLKHDILPQHCSLRSKTTKLTWSKLNLTANIFLSSSTSKIQRYNFNAMVGSTNQNNLDSILLFNICCFVYYLNCLYFFK